MANRYQTPVLFAMEKNLVWLSAHVLFDASGAASLDTSNSKGICNFVQNTPTFSGSIGSGSATITSVSSFQGLFTGMVLGGGTVNGSPTIGTISAATGSIVLSAAASVTAGSSSFTAAGGQYIMQFGTQAALRLDPYFKLLMIKQSFDSSTGSAIGTATQVQTTPVAPTMLIIQNNTRVRTIPATATSGSTDCSLTLQFGNGTGVGFIAKAPAAGEGLRIETVFGNSSAP